MSCVSMVYVYGMVTLGVIVSHVFSIIYLLSG